MDGKISFRGWQAFVAHPSKALNLQKVILELLVSYFLIKLCFYHGIGYF